MQMLWPAPLPAELLLPSHGISVAGWILAPACYTLSSLQFARAGGLSLSPSSNALAGLGDSSVPVSCSISQKADLPWMLKEAA